MVASAEDGPGEASAALDVPSRVVEVQIPGSGFPFFYWVEGGINRLAFGLLIHFNPLRILPTFAPLTYDAATTFRT
jgi:hypothetical protein